MTPEFCSECGAREFSAFEAQSLPLGSGGQVHGLSGVRCSSCGQVYLDKTSHARYAQVSDAAVHAVRQAEEQMLRKVLSLP